MSSVTKIYETTPNDEVKGTQMTVYRALTKRKIYLDKINRSDPRNSEYVGYASKTADTINGIPREKYENVLKSNYDSMVANIRNFFELNAKIALSNATTNITVADQTYTVQEAIVRYDRIDKELEFLHAVAKNIVSTRGKVISRNENSLMDMNILSYVNSKMVAFSDSNLTDKISADDLVDLQNKFREEYIEQNTLEVVDPYNLEERIQKMIDDVKAFKEEFNEALNVSNMQTIITVNLVADGE